MLSRKKKVGQKCILDTFYLRKAVYGNHRHAQEI